MSCNEKFFREAWFKRDKQSLETNAGNVPEITDEAKILAILPTGHGKFLISELSSPWYVLVKTIHWNFFLEIRLCLQGLVLSTPFAKIYMSLRITNYFCQVLDENHRVFKVILVCMLSIIMPENVTGLLDSLIPQQYSYSDYFQEESTAYHWKGNCRQ